MECTVEGVKRVHSGESGGRECRGEWIEYTEVEGAVEGAKGG